VKAYPVKFTWKGSPDPKITSGLATFSYHNDFQFIELELPDFQTAHALSNLIQSVYEGGKIDGLKMMQHAVDNAIRNIISE